MINGALRTVKMLDRTIIPNGMNIIHLILQNNNNTVIHNKSAIVYLQKAKPFFGTVAI